MDFDPTVLFSWGIALGVAILAGVMLRVALTLRAWKQGHEFFTEPEFQFFRPFVSIKWFNQRIGDSLFVYQLVLSALITVGLLLQGDLGTTIATGFGLLLTLFKPQVGNLVLCVFERYDIQPSKSGLKPPKPPQKSGQREVPQPSPVGTTPAKSSASSTNRKKPTPW